MRKLLLGVVSALALLGMLFPRCAAAQKLVVGWSAVSALNSPYWVMQDAGFLKQEGLDTDLIYIASSSTIAQAQLAGDVSVSTANSQVIADIGLQGGDLIAMGSVINVAAFYIMASPEIKRVEDLRGKPVGVTRYGASTDFSMRLFLRKYGLEPVRDVPIIQIGEMPAIAAALSKHSIYAAPMSYPMAFIAQQAGIKTLANLAKEDIPFVHVGIGVTRRFVKDHRAQAKAVLRAYGRAVHFMHTNKEEYKKILAKYSKVTDPAMLDGSVQYAYDFVEKVPLVKPQAFQVTLDVIAQKNPKAKSAKPEQFFDNSLVQELINEKFFVSLWGKNP
ncbi:MAG TPA: ABC transporter substrate-binding protein [Candidatus Binatia bacterium]|jgi:ABC-type nitrate/sulfonate/bicarbonate transport system substrate-binding protein